MALLGWELATAIDSDNPVAGDIRVVGQRFSRLASTPASIAQACTVELRWWLEEWSFDARRGVPYLTKLFVNGVSERTIRAVLNRVVKGVAGVRRLASADIAIDHVNRIGRVTNVVIELLNGGTMPVGNDPFPVGGR